MGWGAQYYSQKLLRVNAFQQWVEPDSKCFWLGRYTHNHKPLTNTGAYTEIDTVAQTLNFKLLLHPPKIASMQLQKARYICEECKTQICSEIFLSALILFAESEAAIALCTTLWPFPFNHQWLGGYHLPHPIGQIPLRSFAVGIIRPACVCLIPGLGL